MEDFDDIENDDYLDSLTELDKLAYKLYMGKEYREPKPPRIPVTLKLMVLLRKYNSDVDLNNIYDKASNIIRKKKINKILNR